MSQHKKQAKPEAIKIDPSLNQQTYTWPIDRGYDPLALPSQLTRLLKAIYRDGVTGTPRNLAKDVETITDLLSKEQQ